MPAARANAGAAVATLRLAASAITKVHQWVGHQSPCRDRGVREALGNRFRDPADPFRIVLVRDMWLTGFDAPSLHTMYVDKPMRGHGLMQAITRVNRVFKDKPGGLVVDYLGLANNIREATITFTESGGTGRVTINLDEAVEVLLEKYEICCALFQGFDRSNWTTGTPQQRLGLLLAAQEHVLGQENGKERCLQVVLELSQAFALASNRPEAQAISDDVGLFQAVRVALSKRATGEPRPEEELDLAVRQIISRAVLPRELLTSSPRQGWTSRTSRCYPNSSWPRCRECPSATWRWSCCKS